MLTAPLRDADVPLPTADNVLEEIPLTWTVHLMHGRLSRLPRIVGVSLLVYVGGWALFHNPLLALLPAAALLSSLAEFLFPIRYTLNERIAQARQGLIVLEIAWADVQHAYLTSEGIKLSPLRRSGSRLEPLRGVFLRFADNESSVTQAVQRFREAQRHV